MKLIALQSGSNGNCFYVESGHVRLLFDAGIAGVQAQRRLATQGQDVRKIDALFISHEHADHVKCAGIYHRKFGLPIHITTKTLRAARVRHELGQLGKICHFQSGSTLQFGSVSVETIPTAHDGTDGVAFVVDDGDRRLGILTDLGHVFDGLEDVIGSLDAVLLESNYDSDLLERGPYSNSLKARIRGPGGHLSNLEAAELLSRAASGRLKWACLAHLSEQNNHPDVACQTHRKIYRNQFELYVAGRYDATPVLNVE